jgi:hypothetical protein
MGTFRLGVQPEWANVEPAVPPSAAFSNTLLGEDPVVSLINRGYCVVPLPASTQNQYSAFYQSFQLFSAQDIKQKSEWAHVQFDPAKHTPNQYHGFSVVAGLKEQFMMRIGGRDSKIPFPTIGGDFGVEGTSLYIALDQLCRQLARGVLENLTLSTNTLEKILDPVGFPEAWKAVRCSEGVSTGYLPPGYVSSSIMDNFHYHGWQSEPGGVQEKQHKRFVNNHSAHTDSGLLTVVVCSDEPALEVFDLQDQVWIALEKCLHLHKANKNDLSHRKYATVFWGDSVDYLSSPSLKACLHRVEKADGERFSVVYKQRTSPLGTAPRYQEDYELGLTQLQSLDRERALRFQNRAALFTLALGVLAKAYFFRQR